MSEETKQIEDYRPEPSAREWYVTWYRATYPNSNVPDGYLQWRAQEMDDCSFAFAEAYARHFCAAKDTEI